jgi:uncharacterized linocin/CFP29 family protein
MNILKKELAPITDEAWKEIADQIQSVINKRNKQLFNCSEICGY